MPVAPAVGDRLSIGDERHYRQSGRLSHSTATLIIILAGPYPYSGRSPRQADPPLLINFSAMETGSPSSGIRTQATR